MGETAHLRHPLISVPEMIVKSFIVKCRLACVKYVVRIAWPKTRWEASKKQDYGILGKKNVLLFFLIIFPFFSSMDLYRSLGFCNSAQKNENSTKPFSLLRMWSNCLGNRLDDRNRTGTFYGLC